MWLYALSLKDIDGCGCILYLLRLCFGGLFSRLLRVLLQSLPRKLLQPFVIRPDCDGKGKGQGRANRGCARAQSSDRSSFPGTTSPGLDDPSLIRMGLAKFTRIVLPKSSDSFYRGDKKHNKAHQKVQITLPPKSLQRLEENSLVFIYSHTWPRSELPGR